jgi:hypothetical protein
MVMTKRGEATLLNGGGPHQQQSGDRLDSKSWKTHQFPMIFHLSTGFGRSDEILYLCSPFKNNCYT